VWIVSVQSTRKSSPWLAELVLVQLLAVSTRHSTAGLWSVTLRPIYTERVYVCRATRVYAHMEHMLKRPARSHQAPLRASALKMEHGSILSASAPVHGRRRARCEWAFKRHHLYKVPSSVQKKYWRSGDVSLDTPVFPMS